MEITVKQVTPWSRALNAARWTCGKDALDKEPSDIFKINAMMSPHSPKRLVEYDIKIKGIPYCNAVHFVRHHIGVEKFQCSLRDDRNEEIDDRRKLPQDYPVNLWMALNADALINISLVRLCHQADATTRKIWAIVKQRVYEIDPIVARFMVKSCVFRGFCPEAPEKCCGYVRSKDFRSALEKYRKGFVQHLDF